MEKSLNDVNNVLHQNSKLVLLHSSKGEFKGKPSVNFGRASCDFGKGLYLSTNFDRVSRINNTSITYKTKIDLNSCKYYLFDDIYKFYMYCVINRGRLYDNVSSKIKLFMDYVNSHEIIIGETIDGMQLIPEIDAFINNWKPLDKVNEELRLDVIGLQYCIKSQSFLDSLSFEVFSGADKFSVSNNIYNYSSVIYQSIESGIYFKDLIAIVERML